MSQTREAAGAAKPAGAVTSSGGDPGGPRRAGSWLRSTPVASSLTFFVFILVFLGYTLWLGKNFSSANNRLLDIHQNVPLLIVGMALAVCLVAGQFDLSVGGMTTLTTYLTVGLVVNQNYPFWLVIIICVGGGLVGGCLNAFLVIKLRVNAFIATLGTGAAFAGLSTVYSGGTQLAPTPTSPTMPKWFSGQGSFGSYQTKAPELLTWVVLLFLVGVVTHVVLERTPAAGRRRTLTIAVAGLVVVIVLLLTVLSDVISDMPWTVLFLLAVAFGLWLTLRYTTFGRYLYATGGNAEAARLAGVHVNRLKAAAFIISATLSSVAGIVLGGIQGSASPDIAAGFLLPAFAAAFLSTVLLSTGRFHIWGTLVGGTFLIWVSQGLIIGGVNFTWTGVINGVVLVTAVSLSTALRREGGR
jgi:ribose/xylose/arabinose/galactoside ABC-type transport system permease subunit